MGSFRATIYGKAVWCSVQENQDGCRCWTTQRASLDARHNGIGDVLIERRIKETLCFELLRNRADSDELNLGTGACSPAPHYMREAERLITEQAAVAPSAADIAAQLGISACGLSEGFRRFTPHAFLTAGASMICATPYSRCARVKRWRRLLARVAT